MNFKEEQARRLEKMAQTLWVERGRRKELSLVASYNSRNNCHGNNSCKKEPAM
jgi:hypothetical protein